MYGTIYDQSKINLVGKPGQSNRIRLKANNNRSFPKTFKGKDLRMHASFLDMRCGFESPKVRNISRFGTFPVSPTYFVFIEKLIEETYVLSINSIRSKANNNRGSFLPPPAIKISRRKYSEFPSELSYLKIKIFSMTKLTYIGIVLQLNTHFHSLGL